MQFETYVKQIIQRAPDVKSFRFNRPEGLDCIAGQYMIITLHMCSVKEIILNPQ